MATPSSTQGQNAAGQGNATNTGAQSPHQPPEASVNTRSTTDALTSAPGEQTAAGKKRRNHRAGRKKKGRRQSFALGNEEESAGNPATSNQELHGPSASGTPRPPFYRLGQSGGNLSSTSLDSQALLDHRYLAHCCWLLDLTRTLANAVLQRPSTNAASSGEQTDGKRFRIAT